MKLRFLVISLSALFLQGTVAKADLQDQYNQSSSISPTQAQYFGTDSNLFGDTWNVSYYVDRRGNIYSFREGSSTGSLLGVIGKRYSKTGNTCFFGNNLQCMGNTMTTITQYGIDSADGYQGCGLYKYSTTSTNFYSSPLLQGDGGSSDVSREELGVCNSSIALRRKKRQAEAAAKKAEEEKTPLQKANDAVQRDPSNARLWNSLANAQIAKEQWEAAKISIDQAIKIDPSDPILLLTGGFIERKGGRYKTAKAMLNKALKLGPEKPEHYYYQMGFIHIDLGEYKQALLNFKEATDYNPNFANALLMEGLVLFELGINNNEVIQSLRESLLHEEQAEAMLALAAVLHQAKEPPNEVIGLASYALVKDPNFVNEEYQRWNYWGERIRSATAALLEYPGLKYPAKMAKANATWKKR